MMYLSPLRMMSLVRCQSPRFCETRVMRVSMTLFPPVHLVSPRPPDQRNVILNTPGWQHAQRDEPRLDPGPCPSWSSRPRHSRSPRRPLAPAPVLQHHHLCTAQTAPRTHSGARGDPDAQLAKPAHNLPRSSSLPRSQSGPAAYHSALDTMVTSPVGIGEDPVLVSQSTVLRPLDWLDDGGRLDGREGSGRSECCAREAAEGA